MTAAGRPVLCGLSDGNGRLPVIRFAAEEAARRSTTLTVVRIYQRPIDPDIEAFDVTDDELAADARSEVEAAVRAAGIEAAVEVVEGDVARGLASMGVGAAVLVVGRRRRHPVQHLLAGSVVHGLLVHADVPVVVVPHD